MPFNKPLRPDSYVQQTLLRYTGSEHTEFKRHVLLTNFTDYIGRFRALGDHVHHQQTWESVHNDELDCSVVCFGIGSPAAAMVMHCLGYLDQVDAAIMLVYDLPLLRTGIKRSDSTREILETFCGKHLDLGVRAVENLKKDKVFKIGEVLSFEW